MTNMGKIVFVVLHSYDTYKGIGTDIKGTYAHLNDAIEKAKEFFENIKADYIDEKLDITELIEGKDYYKIADNDCSHEVFICYQNIL